MTTIAASLLPRARIGLGVFRASPEEAYAAVRSGLAAGYRHIDTAQIYRNEAAVGRAVRDSGLKRDEVFVTTKLWNDDQHPARLRASVARSIETLGLGAPDLFLLHWPVPGLRLGAWAALALAAATWPAPWSALVTQTAEAGGLFVNAIHEFVSMRQVDVPVVLLGDAAHLLSPITGSGAGMAIQDALTLGHWLGQTHDVRNGSQRGWAGLGRAMDESQRAAYQALLRSRAWATEALGVAMPTQAPADGDVPHDEVNP